MTALAPPLSRFLGEHLPRDRRASPHLGPLPGRGLVVSGTCGSRRHTTEDTYAMTITQLPADAGTTIGTISPRVRLSAASTAIRMAMRFCSVKTIIVRLLFFYSS